MVNLYIDNGREYLSNEMKEFCVQKGVSYLLAVPHTPQQNDVSERMIRSITEKAREFLVRQYTFPIKREKENLMTNLGKVTYRV